MASSPSSTLVVSSERTFSLRAVLSAQHPLRLRASAVSRVGRLNKNSDWARSNWQCGVDSECGEREMRLTLGCPGLHLVLRL